MPRTTGDCAELSCTDLQLRAVMAQHGHRLSDASAIPNTTELMRTNVVSELCFLLNKNLYFRIITNTSEPPNCPVLKPNSHFEENRGCVCDSGFVQGMDGVCRRELFHRFAKFALLYSLF